MIYQPAALDEPLRQGDIFVRLPRLDISLDALHTVGDDEIQRHSWEDLKDCQEPLAIIAAARAVTAVVVTQNCDAVRAPDITLCEVRPFPEVDGKARSAQAPKSWMRIITQHARLNLKWFYLPPSEGYSIPEKMAIDFMATMRLPRTDLEAYRRLRVGRLSDYASAHFRERIASFFRRYAYDEWYSLDAEEMAAYQNQYPDAKPFPWQVTS